MSKKLLMRSLLAITVIFAIGLIGTTNETGGAPAVLNKDNPAVQVVMEAQDRHTAELMSIAGVVGTGTGLTQSGQLAIIVYTKSDISQAVPKRMEGIPVRVKVTGEIFALDRPLPDHDHGGNQGGGGKPGIDPTAIFSPPVPIGVSTGPDILIIGVDDCIAGTIGARVKNIDTGDVYALSVNHNYALENKAPIGTPVLQPGLFDTGCLPDVNNVIGTLDDFQPIDFSTPASNTIDAAIALSATVDLDNATPSDGYGIPSSTIVLPKAALGNPVQKYGRTTGLTKGTVAAINVTINIVYNTGIAQFVNQIQINGRKGGFAKSGDSGSLLVTDPGTNPVGLIFAAGSKGGKTAFANPIADVLGRFNVTIDGTP